MTLKVLTTSQRKHKSKDKDIDMLYLTNAEGTEFNSDLDNYLVINLINQKMCDITYEQLEWIVEVTERFHTEALVIEANDSTADVVDYLVNIDKLKCFSRKEVSCGTYFQVKRNELN